MTDETGAAQEISVVWFHTLRKKVATVVVDQMLARLGDDAAKYKARPKHYNHDDANWREIGPYDPLRPTPQFRVRIAEEDYDDPSGISPSHCRVRICTVQGEVHGTERGDVMLSAEHHVGQFTFSCEWCGMEDSAEPCKCAESASNKKTLRHRYVHAINNRDLQFVKLEHLKYVIPGARMQAAADEVADHFIRWCEMKGLPHGAGR